MPRKVRLRTLSIGAVARQTGIDAATLRKWESRYGFPRPDRTGGRHRSYRPADVDILQAVALRVGNGERIGAILRGLHVPAERLPRPAQPVGAGLAPEVQRALSALCLADYSTLKQQLEGARQGLSLLAFIEQLVAPLTMAVGQAWAHGDLPVHAEHLYSGLITAFLDREIAACATCGPPRYLLVTPTGEAHGLGQLMVHAVLAERRIECVRLAPDLPNSEIAAAAQALGVGHVALSASSYMGPRLLQALVEDLRQRLSTSISLVVGGAGFDRISRLPEGVCHYDALRDFALSAGPMPACAESVLPGCVASEVSP